MLLSKCLFIIILVQLLSGLRAKHVDPILVWPSEAPDEPAGIESKKAKAVTGFDGVIRIPYVDTPELHHFPAPPGSLPALVSLSVPVVVTGSWPGIRKVLRSRSG